jgi:N-acetylneuraminate synthase
MSIFIIAEIGINHNGDLGIAKELIEVAWNAGCNAVKFQKRNIEKVYTQEFLDSKRDSPWGSTQREQKAGLELTQQDYEEINLFCQEKGIDWFASAWDKDSQMFLQQFNCKYNKVASAMIVDKKLLELIASERRHTFVSTGMSTYEDIQNAIDIFKEAECPFELMHTVSIYPMKDEDANLNMIKTLREKFGCKIGYSGHEVGLAVSHAAAALGITSLERHITLDRAMYGSDQAASIEPNGLIQLVGAIRKIEKALGDGQKRVLDEEVTIARKLREHIDWEAHYI